MNSLRHDIESKLKEVDAGRQPISEMDIHDALNVLSSQRDSTEGREPICFAEIVAFSFMENSGTSNPKWKTYFGPLRVVPQDDGTARIWPDISQVTPEMLAYWERRAIECSHPILKVRYADLVWDFTRPVAGKGAPVLMAQTVVDSSLSLVSERLFDSRVDALQKLRRALSVAVSIRDTERTARVCDAMIEFEKQVTEDSHMGLWGICYDDMLASKKIALKPEQEEWIVRALEERLTRCAGGSNTQPPKPHAAEHAAVRLAQYYKRKGSPADCKRVLLLYRDAFVKASESVPAATASLWLQGVFSVLTENRLQVEAEEVHQRLLALSGRAKTEMQSITGQIEVPADKLEPFLNAMCQGTQQECLRRFASHYIPDATQVEEQVKNLAKTAVFSSIVPIGIQNEDGLTAAKIGSVYEDIEGRVVYQMSENMLLIAPFLRAAISRIRERHHLSTDDVVRFLAESPAFAPENMELLKRGIAAYLDDDYCVFCHLTVPQVEHALRTVLRGMGGAIYKLAGDGCFEAKGMGAILWDARLANALRPEVVTYFRVLFVDGRGWNLRNTTAHGLTPSKTFDFVLADRLFHALLVLGCLRATGTCASGTGRGGEDEQRTEICKTSRRCEAK